MAEQAGSHQHAASNGQNYARDVGAQIVVCQEDGRWAILLGHGSASHGGHVGAEILDLHPVVWVSETVVIGCKAVPE